MLLDIAFLDDSTRPKAPKLSGLTEAQKEPGRHLAEVHDHLRDNMVALGRLIDRAAAGEANVIEVRDSTSQLELVANYRRFGNLCGQHCQIVHMHHSIEDQAIFPQIAAQGDAFRKVAERLEAEHVVVHEVLVRLIEALEALARDPGPSRFADARELYEALAQVLLSHLGYEEDSIGDALGYFGVM